MLQLVRRMKIFLHLHQIVIYISLGIVLQSCFVAGIGDCCRNDYFILYGQIYSSLFGENLFRKIGYGAMVVAELLY